MNGAAFSVTTLPAMPSAGTLLQVRQGGEVNAMSRKASLPPLACALAAVLLEQQ
jgi:hypothetical protein